MQIRIAEIEVSQVAIDFLKMAAERLRKKGIDQWSIWLNPSKEKLKWIQEGFLKKDSKKWVRNKCRIH